MNPARLTKSVVPALGALVAAAALLVVSALRNPAGSAPPPGRPPAEAAPPRRLSVKDGVPTMEQVVAKHLFVPERTATGENAFPNLLVKGVYVGGGRSAVLSLKNKPEANLRVWLGDEQAAIALVKDERDPRRPIADFLGEWQIQAIDFAGVTVEHLVTGEVETYAVDYTPEKKVKDSAQAGYGQGVLPDEASPGAARSGAAPRAPQVSETRPPGAVVGDPAAMAGRVGAVISRMTPEQRQQFLQQLNKEQAPPPQQGKGSAPPAQQGGKGAKTGASANRGTSR